MGNTQVDQPRFFTAVDHLYRYAEHRLRGGREIPAVPRLAQGVGTYNPQAIRGHAVQHLLKA